MKRLAAVLALVAACGPAAPKVINRPYPPPAAADLLRVVTARQAAVRSLNGRARATSWIGGQRLRATVLMLVERAGRLRLEAEVSLQGTVSVLTTNGERFQLLDVRKNELSQGPACPSNVASLIRIPLAPSQVAAILLGDAELPAGAAERASVSWDGQRGADVLVAPYPNGTSLHVLIKKNGQTDDIIGVEHTGPIGSYWRTAYEDLEGAAGARLPTVIRFAEGQASFDDGVEIKLKDHTLNAELPDADFVIAPPAGTKVVEVGCGS